MYSLMVKQYHQQRKTLGMAALMDVTMVMANMVMVNKVMVNMVMVNRVKGIIFACITEVLAMVMVTTMVMMAMEVTVDMCKILTFIKSNIL